MKYPRLVAISQKQKQWVKLCKLWSENATVDEFKLAVAMAGIKLSFYDKLVFWTLYHKLQHPKTYWTAVILLVLSSLLGGAVIAFQLNLVICTSFWSIAVIGLWTYFFNMLHCKHGDIEYISDVFTVV